MPPNGKHSKFQLNKTNTSDLLVLLSWNLECFPLDGIILFFIIVLENAIIHLKSSTKNNIWWRPIFILRRTRRTNFGGREKTIIDEAHKLFSVANSYCFLVVAKKGFLAAARNHFLILAKYIFLRPP